MKAEHANSAKKSPSPKKKHSNKYFGFTWEEILCKNQYHRIKRFGIFKALFCQSLEGVK